MDDTTRALLDRVEADFTSIRVKQVSRGPAERWIDAVRQTITGFDATRASSPTIRPRSRETARDRA